METSFGKIIITTTNACKYVYIKEDSRNSINQRWQYRRHKKNFSEWNKINYKKFKKIYEMCKQAAKTKPQEKHIKYSICIVYFYSLNDNELLCLLISTVLFTIWTITIYLYVRLFFFSSSPSCFFSKYERNYVFALLFL